MSLSRSSRAISGGLLLAALALVSAAPARAQLDHTSIYRGLASYICGEGWEPGTGTSCLDRDPPLTENNLVDLADELLRLEAISSYEDQIEETERIEIDFYRLCEEDPARCLGWIRDFARTGSLDGDRDGVLDGADQCPGTTTIVSRAQSILLAQEVVLAEFEDIWREIFKIILIGLNGTLGSAERFTLGDQLVPLFNDLYSLANEESQGRFAFGGLHVDGPPFERTGSFLDPNGPVISYRGSTESLYLPIGTAGELAPVAVPGSRLFLGDDNFDGLAPDSDRFNLFGFIIRVRRALQDNDVAGLRYALIDFDEAIAFQIRDTLVFNRRAFALTKRIYPSREHSEVDFDGCNQAQFCARIAIDRPKDERVCVARDFRNDEPLKTSPRDCRIRRVGKGARCETTDR